MQNVTTQKGFEKLVLDLMEYPKTTKTCCKRTGSHAASTKNIRYERENINWKYNTEEHESKEI